MNDTKIKEKRGRPRKLDPQRGLKQATELFLKFGFESVSIQDLCQKLAAPATSIYSTFGNKETLFEKVLDAYCNDYFELLDCALEQAKDAPAMFRSTLEFSADFYLNHNQKWGCLLLQGSSNCKHQEIVKMVTEKQQLLYYRILNRMLELEADNAKELTNVLLTLIRGMAMTIPSSADEDEVFTTIEFFCSAFDC